MDSSKRARSELSLLVDDKLHSSLESIDLNDLEPLSPLTPLIGELGLPSYLNPEGSTKYWCRHADKGFLLDGEIAEDLKGIDYTETVEPEAVHFTKGVKKLIKSICCDIIADWPPFDDTSTSESRNVMIFVTPHAFYDLVFKNLLQLKVNRFINNGFQQNSSSQKNTPESHGLLQSLLEGSTRKQTLFMIHNMFIQHVLLEQPLNPIRSYAALGEENKYAFANAKRLGKRSRDNAVWIGLERVEPNHLKSLENKFLVESRRQIDKGIKLGGYEEDDLVNIANTTYRICAPTDSNKTPSSVILWTKSAKDDLPEWRKVIGGFVYNLDKLDPIFSAAASKVKDDVEATMIYLRDNEPVLRDRFPSEGPMVKAGGYHAVFGQSYNNRIKERKMNSQNPRPETVERASKQKQLRIRMKATHPIMQTRDFMFLESFLPNFAAEQMDVAKSSPPLLNVLGYPNTSSFATFGYCAGLHLDGDDSASAGWVMKRDQNIPSNESNFVWGSHGLIVEMHENQFWFWNAPQDSHGTTMNHLALSRPGNYKQYLKSEQYRSSAQWTRVSVMPSVVVAAAGRQM